MSDVPSEKQKIYEQTVWKKVHHDVRIKKTRWVVLRWPSPSMAQMAEIEHGGVRGVFLQRLHAGLRNDERAMQPLKAAMERTDKVRFKGPGETDLPIFDQGIPRSAGDGRVNIPDGEVFTAPVRDSVNGVISSTAPPIYRGVTHNDIRLVFKNGRSSKPPVPRRKADEVLDADERGALYRRVAIGFNPYVNQADEDILFDERSPAASTSPRCSCYDEASNEQEQHPWDMVMRQDPEVGGGEIWFDDQLCGRMGGFLLKELEGIESGESEIRSAH